MNENNRLYLKRLMAKHGMTNQQMADLACVSVKTVQSWRLPPGNAMHRNLSDKRLEMIKRLLAANDARSG